MGIKTLPALAGADRVVERLLEHLPGDLECCIYLVKGRQVRQLKSDASRHYVYLPALPGKHLRAFSFFALCTMHALVRSDYSIVHAHNSDFGVFCSLLRLKRNVRIVGTFHGNPYQRKKWGTVARWYLRTSEWFFVHSCHVLTSVARSNSETYQQMYGRDVHYIPNGVDTFVPPDQNARFDCSKMGLRPGGYFMFACGRVDATKGLHHVISAYKRGKWTENLFIVGDFNHDKQYSEAMDMEVAGEPGIVVQKTLLPRMILLDAIRQCRLFVFPSEVEAMSMVLLEAIAAGCPVVCSDIPENRDVVGEDYEYLFHSGDANDLRRVMGVALSDPDARSIAERLHRRCVQTFAWDSIAQRYLRLYNSLQRSSP